MPLRILVDMDDVIVDLHTPWVHAVNKAEGSNLHHTALTTWERLPEKVWNAVLRIPGFFLSLDWEPGARGGLMDLKAAGHDVYIVSSPVVWEACRDKYHWVHTHLRVYDIIPSMDRLVLTRSKHIVRGDVLIDDNPQNLESWLKENPGGKVVLYAQPWNADKRGEIHDGIVSKDLRWFVAYSWGQVVKAIEMIEDGHEV